MPRGSKPGERRGGRQKGTKNRRTAEIEAAVAATGLTPKEYMLKIMRDDTLELDQRFAAAKAVAPYCHSQLASVHHDGEGLTAVLAEPIEIVLVAPKGESEGKQNGQAGHGSGKPNRDGAIH
jgi:hypothetical protein